VAPKKSATLFCYKLNPKKTSPVPRHLPEAAPQLKTKLRHFNIVKNRLYDIFAGLVFSLNLIADNNPVSMAIEKTKKT